MPLVAGKYPNTNWLWKLTGNLASSAQGNVPARSNLEWFGAGSLVDGALASTGVAAAVACPVEVGDVITKVTIITGATAASTPTHQFVALYGFHATAPPLIVQSTDTTTAAVVLNTAATYTLSTPTKITSTHAPQGYIYVAYVQTGTTISTAISATTTTAASLVSAFSATSPLFLSMTAGSGLTTTAAATLASPAAKAVAPIVFLT